MKWEDLTRKQRDVIESQARKTIVFGGAGSGKTTVALWCARHLLEREGVAPWHRALFLTFSKTAVRELSTRAASAVREVNDRIEVHTFHSFSHRLLSAFGRYVGLGLGPPSLQSPPEEKLFGRDRSQFVYDDLLPHALKIIRDPLISRLLTQRWPIVVCDEFQDTDDLQWELLCALAENARLVLFADPNQMIYTFLRSKGVGQQRVDTAIEQADLVEDLGSPSHRDPSGIIPSMADAVRRRDFEHAAVQAALDQQRLVIRSDVDEDSLCEVIRSEVVDARRSGAQSVAIFGHTNQAVADLGVNLHQAGVEHVLVGLPEAHAEALAAMEGLFRYGLGLVDRDEVQRRLAVFLTSAVRGRNIPPLAQALVGQQPLSETLEQRLAATLDSLKSANERGLQDLVSECALAWEEIGVTSGRRPWRQAAKTFGANAYQIISTARGERSESAVRLEKRVAELRGEVLVEAGLGQPHPVQLMNFHQTKGREADVVVLVYRDDDFFGHEGEPFEDNSRLLYVSLTRAKQRNVVVLLRSPHPLVAPFAPLGR